MPDMSLSMSLDDQNDDLPKTLRRKSMRTSDEDLKAMAAPANPQKVVVTDINISFWRLSLFLMKVALASLPALIILGAVVYGLAEVIGTLFPQLVKLKIQIYVPK